MAFIRKQGMTKVMFLPVTPSTAIAIGSLVVFSAGKLIAATSATTKHVGVLREEIASTDDDFADDRLVPVEVPIENWVVWEVPVTAGLVPADIGLYQDLTDALTVDRAASVIDAVMCVGVISATLGLFTLTDRADLNN